MKREVETVSMISAFVRLADNNYKDTIDYQLEWIQQYIDLPMSVLKDNIALHKRKFGNQEYCFNSGSGERFWVWSGEKWRALVSHRGTTFEVLPNLTLDELKETWNDYYGKLMHPLLPFM